MSYTTPLNSSDAYPLSNPPSVRDNEHSSVHRNLLTDFMGDSSDDDSVYNEPGLDESDSDEPDSDEPADNTPAAMAEHWDIEAAETAANALKAHGCSY